MNNSVVAFTLVASRSVISPWWWRCVLTLTMNRCASFPTLARDIKPCCAF